MPTFEIDIFWHTHMTGATPAQYRSDCEAICGWLFDHDDSMEDRTIGGELDISFQKTAALWNETYGDDTYMSRGGYKGEQPADYFPKKESRTDSTDSDISKESKAGKQLSKESKFAKRFQENTSRVSKAIAKPHVFLPIAFIIGIVLIGAGFGTRYQNSYVCGGGPPSAEEITTRGVPVCLTSNVASGNLCLKAGEDPNDPPVWCYQDIRVYGAYFLWWSPCTKCGTAWRMDETRDDDKSRYKMPASRPEFPEMPSAYGWLEWRKDGRWISRDDFDSMVWQQEGHWSSTNVEFQECPLNGAEESGVPDACYDDRKNPLGRIFGFIGVAFIVLAVLMLVVYVCKDHCDSSTGGGRGGSRSYGGSVFVGGGGCGGGGGGGCGGC